MSKHLYPRARQAHLPEAKTQGKIEPRLFLIHTAVDAPGPTDLGRFFGRSDVHVESTFWNRLDGYCDQFMPANVRADAQYRANSFTISVECEDDGDSTRPFTDAQVERNVDLGVWVCLTYGIAPKLASKWDGSGIGCHNQFKNWSKYAGKTCPGPARTVQVKEIIIPRIARGIEELAAWAAGKNPPPLPPPPVPATPKRQPAQHLNPLHPLAQLKRDIEAASKQLLRRGSHGKHVEALQIVCNGHAPGALHVDGLFGGATEATIKWFQATGRLQVDGIVGPKTWAHLLRNVR